MSAAPETHLILCNGAKRPGAVDVPDMLTTRLDYEALGGTSEPNMRVSLARLMEDVNHVPLRVRDLIEIASFVYCADRLIHRGDRDALEHVKWSRRLHFTIKVRDAAFWRTPEVSAALSSAILYMSGDYSIDFTFESGRPEPVTGLFDDASFLVQPTCPLTVSLFSGGIDSTAGAIRELEAGKTVYLATHRSGQPSTIKTQHSIIQHLKRVYGEERVIHYKYTCHLQGVRGQDENQRTRAFLYGSIAYALARTVLSDSFTVFENGVTAINMPKREDMWSARASRTAHPRTLGLLSRVFSLVGGHAFAIKTPLLWSTKADVLALMKESGRSDVIPLTVSCSKTFKSTVNATHCGACTQCVERRLAAHASGVTDYDHPGLYSTDLSSTPIAGEDRTIAVDYVRSALHFANQNIDTFYKEHVNELADLIDQVGHDEEIAVQRVYELHHRHGLQVMDAIRQIINCRFDPGSRPVPCSFLETLLAQEYLLDPAQRLAAAIVETLRAAIPLTFRKQAPINESDLNDKMEGVLTAAQQKLSREHPTVSFALAKCVPDHSDPQYGLFVETKYLRAGTSPSRATEDIAADLTKYPDNVYLLFVVYDPDRAISDDTAFCTGFQQRRHGRCTIAVVR